MTRKKQETKARETQKEMHLTTVRNYFGCVSDEEATTKSLKVTALILEKIQKGGRLTITEPPSELYPKGRDIILELI